MFQVAEMLETDKAVNKAKQIETTFSKAIC